MKSSEFIREAKRKGWVLHRQGKGSHAIYIKDGKRFRFPITEEKKFLKDWKKL